jgi:hypothetical protein
MNSVTNLMAPHRYEHNVRAELSAGDRSTSSDDGGSGGHGWFTTTADNHSKHEVCAQDKTIIAHAVAKAMPPASPKWETIPCDIAPCSFTAGHSYVCATVFEDGRTSFQRLHVLSC